MSKVSFRARALDANRPLPIYHHDEIPDVTDFSIISRNVPQIPTGMEKEEEAECHLQEALQAFQQYKLNDFAGIPVPEIIMDDSKFKTIYSEGFKPPRNYIRIQAYTFSDDEAPEYDVDDEDAAWLRKHSVELGIDSETFESMLDKLERSSGHKVAELAEAKALLKQDDDLTIAVYDYWLNKRLNKEHALIPSVKSEKRDGTSDRDPYVAFRRRTEKMQTRKNRKNDEHSYEKMLLLNRDMIKSLELLQLVCRREKLKQEQVRIARDLYERRYEMHDFAGSHLTEALAAVRRTPSTLPRLSEMATSRGTAINTDQHLRHEMLRQHKQALRRQRKLARVRRRSRSITSPHYMFSSEGEEHSDAEIGAGAGSIRSAAAQVSAEEAFPFRRIKGAVYAAPRGPLPNYNRAPLNDSRHRFQLTCLTSTAHSRRQRFTGYLRQRIGRGGRRVFDRMYGSPSTEEYLSCRDTSWLSDDDDSDLPSVFRRQYLPCDKQEEQHSVPESVSKRTLGCFSGEVADSPKVVKAVAVVSSNGGRPHEQQKVMAARERSPQSATAMRSAVVHHMPSPHQNGMNISSAARLPPASASTMVLQSSKAREQQQHQQQHPHQHQQHQQLPQLQQITSSGSNGSDGGVSLGLSTEPAANIKQLNYPLSSSTTLHGLGVVATGTKSALGHPRILKVASGAAAPVSVNRRKRKSEEYVVVTSDSEMDVG